MNNRPEQQEKDKKEEKRYNNVLIPVSNPDTAEQLVRLAARITTPSSTLHIMSVTTEKHFTKRSSSWRKSSKVVMEMTRLARQLSRVAKPKTATSKSIPAAVLKKADEIEADLIIMGWFGRIIPVAVKRSKVVNKILHRADCDTAILKSLGQIQQVERVIFPVDLNLNRERFAVAKAFRRITQTKIILLNVLTPNMKREEGKIREALSQYAEELSGPIEVRVIRAKKVSDGILSVAEKQDLIVIGPGREWVFNRFLFGLRADQITNRAACSVLMYKSKEIKAISWLRGLFKAAGMNLSSWGKK